jgi:hypothetical protein
LSRADLLDAIAEAKWRYGEPAGIVHGANVVLGAEMLEGIGIPVHMLRTAPRDGLYILHNAERIAELLEWDKRFMEAVA